MFADESGATVFMGPFCLNHAVVLEDIVRWTIENRAGNPGIAADNVAQARLPHRPDGLVGTIELLGPKSQARQGPNDIYEITFFGGAGYGDPLDRPPSWCGRTCARGPSHGKRPTGYTASWSTREPGEIDIAATRIRKSEIRRERLGGAEHPNEVPALWSRDPAEDRTALSEYVKVEADRIACRKCGYDICSSAECYKLHLVTRESPVTALSPLNRDPSHYVDDEIVCRAFYCPGCATQNEFEITDASLPPIWDCQLDP